MLYKFHPGDMIEWVYKYNNVVVDKGEMCWSTLMNKWIPIDTTSLLISVTQDEYAWLSEKGLFYARVKDTRTVPWGNYDRPIVPRKLIP